MSSSRSPCTPRGLPPRPVRALRTPRARTAAPARGPGTGVDAPRTSQALPLPAERQVAPGHQQYRGDVPRDGNFLPGVLAGKRVALHRAAEDDRGRARREASGLLHQLTGTGADANFQVPWRAQRRAGHGDDAFETGPGEDDGIVQGCEGGHGNHHRSQVQGGSPSWRFPAEQRCREQRLLLLRVAFVEDGHLEAFARRMNGSSDSIRGERGFCAHGEDNPPAREHRLRYPEALGDFRGPFGEQPELRGEPRLAFDGMCDEHLRGPARAAASRAASGSGCPSSATPASAMSAMILAGSSRFQSRSGLGPSRPGESATELYHRRQAGRSVTHGGLAYLDDGTGDRRVDRYGMLARGTADQLGPPSPGRRAERDRRLPFPPADASAPPRRAAWLRWRWVRFCSPGCAAERGSRPAGT